MTGDDTGLLVVTGSVSSQLQDLSMYLHLLQARLLHLRKDEKEESSESSSKRTSFKP